MPKYRIVSGSYSRFENGERVSYKKGDDVEMTTEQAAPRKYQVRLLSEVEAEAAASAPAPDVIPEEENKKPKAKAKDWSDLLSGTTVEIGIEIGRMESIGDLESLRAAEEAGGERRTVLKAISNRIEALGDEDL